MDSWNEPAAGTVPAGFGNVEGFEAAGGFEAAAAPMGYVDASAFGQEF